MTCSSSTASRSEAAADEAVDAVAVAERVTRRPRAMRHLLVLVRSALAALIWHPGNEPLETIVVAARDDRRPLVRSQALFWLSLRAGQQAVGTIRSAVDNDPETEVKKKAVFALSQLPKNDGVPLLIEIAQSNRNREVRKQAMFWLGQSKDPRAISFFEQVLK